MVLCEHKIANPHVAAFADQQSFIQIVPTLESGAGLLSISATDIMKAAIEDRETNRGLSASTWTFSQPRFLLFQTGAGGVSFAFRGMRNPRRRTFTFINSFTDRLPWNACERIEFHAIHQRGERECVSRIIASSLDFSSPRRIGSPWIGESMRVVSNTRERRLLEMRSCSCVRFSFGRNFFFERLDYIDQIWKKKNLWKYI